MCLYYTYVNTPLCLRAWHLNRHFIAGLNQYRRGWPLLCQAKKQTDTGSPLKVNATCVWHGVGMGWSDIQTDRVALSKEALPVWFGYCGFACFSISSQSMYFYLHILHSCPDMWPGILHLSLRCLSDIQPVHQSVCLSVCLLFSQPLCQCVPPRGCFCSTEYLGRLWLLLQCFSPLHSPMEDTAVYSSRVYASQ